MTNAVDTTYLQDASYLLSLAIQTECANADLLWADCIRHAGPAQKAQLSRDCDDVTWLWSDAVLAVEQGNLDAARKALQASAVIAQRATGDDTCEQAAIALLGVA